MLIWYQCHGRSIHLVSGVWREWHLLLSHAFIDFHYDFWHFHKFLQMLSISILLTFSESYQNLRIDDHVLIKQPPSWIKDYNIDKQHKCGKLTGTVFVSTKSKLRFFTQEKLSCGCGKKGAILNKPFLILCILLPSTL